MTIIRRFGYRLLISENGKERILTVTESSKLLRSRGRRIEDIKENRPISLMPLTRSNQKCLSKSQP